MKAFFPSGKFRNLLFEKLRADGKLLVLDPGKKSGASSLLPAAAGDSSIPLAVIQAQLYGTRDRLFLALQLLDGRSNQLFWSGIKKYDPSRGESIKQVFPTNPR